MKNKNNIYRKTPSIETGLSNSEVEERKRAGLTNKTKSIFAKSILEILFDDVFTALNILSFVIVGLMISAQNWFGLLFLVALLPAFVINLVFDLMPRLKTLRNKKACVVRDGAMTSVSSKEIVMDDILYLENGERVLADGVLLEGNVLVDESSVFGTTKPILKNKGDYIYSGSQIVFGNAYIHASMVGEESFIERIKEKAKITKSPNTSIHKTINMVLEIIGVAIAATLIFLIVLYGIKGKLDTYNVSMKEITSFVAIAMPVGLLSLVAILGVVTALRLRKISIKIQNLKAIQSLANADIICFDKTGTLTAGEFEVKKTLLYGTHGYSMEDISQIISNILKATNNSDFTAKALQKQFSYELITKVLDVIPFNEGTNYTAATFSGGVTYVMGESRYLNLPNKSALEHRAEEYTNKGMKVLVLAKSDKPINNQKVDGLVEPIALVVLQNQIKPEIIQAIKSFMDQGKEIKIISGDDALAISHIAAEYGIKDADKSISLKGLFSHEVRTFADKFTLFADATPEQKELIVQALQKTGKKVAFVGDGINDILALKRADCSIAMDSADENAKRVSSIVLQENKLEALADLNEIGVKTTNGIFRATALLITQSIFITTLLLTLGLVVAIVPNMSFPYSISQFQLFTVFNIFFAAVLLIFESNSKTSKGTPFVNLLRKSIPAAIVLSTGTLLPYLLLALQETRAFYTGVYTTEVATIMSVTIMTVLGLVVLYKICNPINLYRGLSLGGVVLVEGALVAATVLLSISNDVVRENIGLHFDSLTLVNWFIIAIIIVIVVATYLLVSYIVEALKGEHQNAKD